MEKKCKRLIADFVFCGMEFKDGVALCDECKAREDGDS